MEIFKCTVTLFVKVSYFVLFSLVIRNELFLTRTELLLGVVVSGAKVVVVAAASSLYFASP